MKRYVIDSLDNLLSDEEESDESSVSTAGADDLNSVGKTVPALSEAKKIVSKIHPPVRREILTFLSHHVHESLRKSSATNKDLIEWLTQTNSRRNYLFYKAAGLKSLVEARGLKLATGQKTVKHIVTALVEGKRGAKSSRNNNNSPSTPPLSDLLSHDLSPVDAATKAILEKSFLPQKKESFKSIALLGIVLKFQFFKIGSKLQRKLSE